ncbi:MAG: ABC transporter permease [Holosporales bacterium]|jgi:His/Glu/Gln/Arg/opine family amino acid ABC transporter permease subunit
MVEWVVRYGEALVAGAFLTVQLVSLAAVLGSVIGLGVGTFRGGRSVFLQRFTAGYIFFFRGTPLLVQLFLIYYGLAQWQWLHGTIAWRGFLDSPFWCAVLALGLNAGAYLGAALRGAINHVPKGDIEAAKSLGMARAVRFRRIVLAQALPRLLPQLGNEMIILVKASALASTVTLMELTGVTRTLVAKTYQPLPFYLGAAVLYLVVCGLLSAAFRAAERRIPVYPYA